MRFQGGILGTGLTHAGTALASLVIAAAVCAQDPWTVPPSASVLVTPDDAPADLAADASTQAVGELTPLQNGAYLVGDGNPADATAGSPGSYESGVYEEYTYGGCADQCSPQADSCISPSCHDSGVRWIGRADALLLFRDAPPDRQLTDAGSAGALGLNANEMDSPLAAGPRFSLFRFNSCNGTGIEATYLRAANWRSQRFLPLQSGPSVLSAPGIYSNDSLAIESGSANLGAALQGFELNRHWCKGEHLRFLAGFRWVEWRESFSLTGTSSAANPVVQQNFFQTDCFNSLYGGQIGLDAWLFTLPWMRVDSVIKAGAYYNNAVQNSLYQSNATGSLLSQSVAVGESPLNCAFVGELGMTGVVPLSSWLDLRVGYFGMWLSGIAQPTQQLSGQVLTAPAGGTDPAVGTINANGSTLVQGVSLGLEGRW